MNVCVYVCVRMRARVHVYACASECARVHVNVCGSVCARVRGCVCMYVSVQREQRKTKHVFQTRGVNLRNGDATGGTIGTCA